MWNSNSRACGKVLCNGCCTQKFILKYLEDNKQSRVCDACKVILEGQESGAAAALATPTRDPPAGVLKKNSTSDQGSASATASPMESKQVMFSDGVRPGGDLTELDGSSSPSRPPSSSSRRRGAKSRSRGTAAVIPHEDPGAGKSMLPENRDDLPPVCGAAVNMGANEAAKMFDKGETISFAVNNNLVVRVKLCLCKCTAAFYFCLSRS
jgi:MAD (mothers against decapentaplegic) interacting protein